MIGAARFSQRVRQEAGLARMLENLSMPLIDTLNRSPTLALTGVAGTVDLSITTRFLCQPAFSPRMRLAARIQLKAFKSPWSKTEADAISNSPIGERPLPWNIAAR